jgi:hypothetical protein
MGIKYLQRRFYDVLSTKFGLFLLIGGILVTLNSTLLLFSGIFRPISRDFGSISRDFRENDGISVADSGAFLPFSKGGPLVVDIVYTWVNGSDPQLQADLLRLKSQPIAPNSLFKGNTPLPLAKNTNNIENDEKKIAKMRAMREKTGENSENGAKIGENGAKIGENGAKIGENGAVFSGNRSDDNSTIGIEEEDAASSSRFRDNQELR